MGKKNRNSKPENLNYRVLWKRSTGLLMQIWVALVEVNRTVYFFFNVRRSRTFRKLRKANVEAVFLVLPAKLAVPAKAANLAAGPNTSITLY